MTIRHRLLLVLVVALAAFSLSGQEGEDGIGAQCGPVADNAVHECHCAHMIEDVQLKYQAECRAKPTKKEREACMNARPNTCDVMDYPARYGAENHPDQCLNKCSKERCTCNEGACSRPPQVKKKRG